MDSHLETLATEYRRRYRINEKTGRQKLNDLYKSFVKEREGSLLDIAAEVIAVEMLFDQDRVHYESITPQHEEAYKLAYSTQSETMTLAERYEQLSSESGEEIQGFLNNLIGKYFEVRVRDQLNSGGRIGDLHLSHDQYAELASDPTQPGFDLIIRNGDGTMDEQLQLKATKLMGPIKSALESGNFRVVTTEEGAAAAAEQMVGEKVLNSGISDEALSSEVRAPAVDLIDSPLENFLEATTPALPFLIITVTEGRKVLVGQQSFQQALNRSADRATRSLASMSVNAILMLAGAGYVTMPASLLTRYSIDRAKIQYGLVKRVQSNTTMISSLASSR